MNWFPWDEEAWDKAKVENKLVLVSIGYSACHWCHVMERETFEDIASGAIMNQHFVCIKVDREERPDVDQVYMDACQLVTHRGGWPLNVFCLPDGRPIHAGTYFPKANWDDMLVKLSHFYNTKKEEAERYASELSAGVQQLDRLGFNAESEGMSIEGLKAVVEKQKQSFDPVYGGFNWSPKFPMPVCWQFLLHFHSYTCDETVKFQVLQTLTQMALGGIYDQVGGGFARYSTDSLWKAPHFEKMLYDNAQLISLYIAGWRLSKDPLYKQVIEETIAFVFRELLSPEGMFFSALDADSEGEEGKFYVWTEAEFEAIAQGTDAVIARAKQNIISDEETNSLKQSSIIDEIASGQNTYIPNKLSTNPRNDGLLKEYYCISQEALWEHGQNILLAKHKPADFAALKGIGPDDWNKTLIEFKRQCLTERAKRIHPGLDDKCITSWNALMIKALAEAYLCFGDETWLEKAVACGDFIHTELIEPSAVADGNGLLPHPPSHLSSSCLRRIYNKGQKSVNAFLEDYALLADAYLSLYESTADENWITRAMDLMNVCLENFFDLASGFFLFKSKKDAPLFAVKTDLTDDVIPSGNSVMAQVMYRLGHLQGDIQLINTATEMLRKVSDQFAKHPTGNGNWMDLQLANQHGLVQLVICCKAEERKNLLADLGTYLLPHVLLVWQLGTAKIPLAKDKKTLGGITFYVCRAHTCYPPVKSLKEAITLIFSI